MVRGRTPRQAIEELIGDERFDTVVIPARTGGSDGFDARDVAWVLESAPSEVLVLRPGQAAGAAAAI